MAQDGPIIDVWHGLRQDVGHLGRPQPHFNLLGRVTPRSSPIYSVAWSIPGEQVWPLALGPTALRLRSPGDFNAEIPIERLKVGVNTVKLIASDEAGNETAVTVELIRSEDRKWPLPWRTDWAKARRIQDVAQVVDGEWALSEAGIRPVVTGYDRLVAIGEMSWSNYSVTVPVTIHSYDTFGGAYRWPSYGPAVGVLMCWQGHQDWGDILPRRGWYPFGSLAMFRWREGRMRTELWGGSRGEIIGALDPRRQPEFEVPYIFKVEVQSRPGETNWYRMKSWPAAEDEPATWDIEGPGTPGELSTGAAVLLAHHTDATFGDAVITPL